jgi:hypothetical protein
VFDKNQSEKLKLKIPISEIKKISNLQDMSWELDTFSGKSHRFLAEDPDENDNWIDLINRAFNDIKSFKSSYRSTNPNKNRNDYVRNQSNYANNENNEPVELDNLDDQAYLMIVNPEHSTEDILSYFNLKAVYKIKFVDFFVTLTDMATKLHIELSCRSALILINLNK